MIVSYLLFLLLLAEVFSDDNVHQNLFEKFHQNDYTVKQELMELISYNKNFVNYYACAFFKYNRTTTAFNFTFNLKMDILKLDIIAQAYKFLSNEYRLFPMRVKYNFCEAMKANVAGLGTNPGGNFTNCAFAKKGQTYHFGNWLLDQSQLPPFIPSGRYMLDLQHLHNSAEVGLVRVYLAAIRPEV